MRISIFFAVLVFTVSAFAGDINKGYTFSAGEQNVTHTKLNNLVDQASINTSFFTDKSAETKPVSSDLFLIYSPTLEAYRKLSLQNLLLGNTDLISVQNEETDPNTTNTFVLVYDSATTNFVRVSLAKIGFGNDVQTTTNLTGDPYIMLKYTGSNIAATISQVIEHGMTNAPPYTAPTNTDLFLVWHSPDGSTGTLSSITVKDFFNTTPETTNLGPSLKIPIVDTNGSYGAVTLSNFSPFIVKKSLMFADIAPNTVSSNWNFGAPATTLETPQIISVTAQSGATLGYSLGEFVGLDAIQWDPGNTNGVTWSVSGTNVVVRTPPAPTGWPKIRRKDTGVLSTMDTNDWSIVVQGIYVP